MWRTAPPTDSRFILIFLSQFFANGHSIYGRFFQFPIFPPSQTLYLHIPVSPLHTLL